MAFLLCWPHLILTSHLFYKWGVWEAAATEVRCRIWSAARFLYIPEFPLSCSESDGNQGSFVFFFSLEKSSPSLLDGQYLGEIVSYVPFICSKELHVVITPRYSCIVDGVDPLIQWLLICPQKVRLSGCLKWILPILLYSMLPTRHKISQFHSGRNEQQTKLTPATYNDRSFVGTHEWLLNVCYF